jgi:hypothetical protein
MDFYLRGTSKVIWCCGGVWMNRSCWPNLEKFWGKHSPNFKWTIHQFRVEPFTNFPTFFNPKPQQDSSKSFASRFPHPATYKEPKRNYSNQQNTKRTNSKNKKCRLFQFLLIKSTSWSDRSSLFPHLFWFLFRGPFLFRCCLQLPRLEINVEASKRTERKTPESIYTTTLPTLTLIGVDSSKRHRFLHCA